MKLHLPKLLRAALMGLFASVSPLSLTVATASSAVALYSVASAADVTVPVDNGATITSAPENLASGDNLIVNMADASGDNPTSATWAVQIDTSGVDATVNVGQYASLTVGGGVNVAQWAVFARGSGKTQTINLKSGSTLTTNVSLAGWEGGEAATVVNMGSGSTWNIESAITDACEYMNQTTINMDGATINIASGKSLRVERNGDGQNDINVFANSGSSSITGAGTINLSNYRLDFGVAERVSGATGGDETITTTPTLSIGVRIEGTHGILKTGDSILELSNDGNNYTGGTTVNGGTLRLAGTGGKAGDSTSAITVAADATLELAHTEDCTTGNAITLNGHLLVTGGHTETLSRSITVGGNLTVERGTLVLNGLTLRGDASVATGSALSLNGDVTISTMINSAGSVSLAEGGTLTLTGVDGLEVSGDVTYSDDVSASEQNGYVNASYYVVKGTGTVTNLNQVTLYGEAYALTGSGGDRLVTLNGTAGIYYVNAGTVVYGGTEGNANNAASAATTGIVLNGGSLEMNQNLNTGVNITLSANGTVSLGENVTLSGDRISRNEHISLTLGGTGKFIHRQKDGDFSLSKYGFTNDWNGTVELEAKSSGWMYLSQNTPVSYKGTMILNFGNFIGVGQNASTTNSIFGEETHLVLNAGTTGRAMVLNSQYISEAKALTLASLSSGVDGDGNYVVSYIRGDMNTTGHRYLKVVGDDSTTFAGFFHDSDDRSVGLIKEGTGNLTLTNSSTSEAALKVNSGTLTFKDGGAWDGAISVGAAGTLAFNGANKVIAEGKTITFAEGATLAVTGGSLTINQALSLTNLALSGGAVKVAASLSVTNLVSSEGSLAFDLAGEGDRAMLTLGSSVDHVSVLLNGGTAGETYQLFDGDNLPTSLDIFLLDRSLVASYNEATGTVTLTDGGDTSARTLVWNSDSNDGFWSADASPDWLISGGNTRSNFANGDSVTFGAGSSAIGVDGTVAVASMTFTSESGNYTLTGGTIELGTTSDSLTDQQRKIFTKNGKGTVTFKNGTFKLMQDVDFNISGGEVVLDTAVTLDGQNNKQLRKYGTGTLVVSGTFTGGATAGLNIHAHQGNVLFTNSLFNNMTGTNGRLVIEQKGAMIGLGGRGGADSFINVTNGLLTPATAPADASSKAVQDNLYLDKTGKGTTIINYGPSTGGRATVFHKLVGSGTGDDGVLVLQRRGEAGQNVWKITLNDERQDGDKLFNGTLRLLSHAWYLSTRNANCQLTVASEHVLSKAVVEMGGAVAGDGNVPGPTELALGAAAVRIAGLSSYNGTSKDPGVFSSDGVNTRVALAAGTNEATLMINTAEGTSYDFQGTVTAGISLEKTGMGSQTFSGDLAAFNGNITVSGGTLTATNVLSAGNVTLSNGGTLAANVTLRGTLSGVGSIDGALTSTAGSVIELDLTGVQANGTALITANRANVTAGQFDLNLSGLANIGTGTYSLLQWEGIDANQFACQGLTGAMELVVENNILSLHVGNPDLYWKSENDTWDDTQADWVMDNPDSDDKLAYISDSTVHFVDDLSADDVITVEGQQTASGMVVESGEWSFTTSEDDGSLSIGSGGITIQAGSVTLTGAVTSEGDVSMIATDSTLVVGKGTVLTLNGLTLTGTATGTTVDTTVTHTGDTEDVLSIASENFSVAHGTLTNTTTGDLTVGLTIVGNDVNLVQSGGGTLTLGGTQTLASLTTTSGSVALTGSTTVGGTDGTVLAGSTVTTGGGAFSLGNTSTEVSGGSVTTSDTTINAVLTDVALTTSANSVTLNGNHTLDSLTTTSGIVVLAGGTTTVGDTDLAGSTVNTGGAAFSLGETTTTVTGGSVTTSDTEINAVLTGVALNTSADSVTLNGTQSISSLTAEDGSTVTVAGSTTVTNLAQCTNMQVDANASLTAAGTVSGTLTNNGTVTASGNLSVGTLTNGATINMDAHDLTLTSATTAGGTISNAGTVTLAGESNAFTAIAADTVSGSGSLSVTGNSSIDNLNGVTAVTVDDASATLEVETADSALMLSGAGKLVYGTDGSGALNLAGASDIGSLKAGSLSLTGTSTLDVDTLELTNGLISLSDLGGMGVGELLVTAGELTSGGSALGTLKVGISVDTIESIAGNFVNASLTLAQVTGLTGVTFADGTTTVTSDTHRREYSIKVENGNIILTYTATGNGWVSTDGTWNDAGGDFKGGDPNGADNGEAAFLGGGTATVNVVGDKTITLLTVDVTPSSTVNTYTFTGNSITAVTGMVASGTMVVQNEILFTGTLTVQKDQSVGHLRIDAAGTVTVSGKATGTIVNNGTLSVGEGSNISLDGNGELTSSGNVTVAMQDGASISTLTVNDGTPDVPDTLTFTTGATVGTLVNNDTVTVEGDLTLTQATDQGGNVVANNLTLAGNSENTFGTLIVDGAVTNTGTLTVGDDTSIGSLSGGSLTVSDGAATLKSDTSLSTLTNNGTLLTVEGNLTLTEATAQGGNVEATNLTLADGTENTFGTLIVSGTVTNTGSLTVGNGTSIVSLSGGGALTTSGNVTVGMQDGASISTLTVGDGKATVTTDTTVNKLAGSGSLSMEGKRLSLNSTETDCAVNITAGTLDLTGSIGALNVGELSLDTIVFDRDNHGTLLKPLVTATGIVSGGITFEQEIARGLLAAGNYTLFGLTGGTVNPDSVRLSAATLSAYQTGGYAAILEVDGSTVQLVVREDNARTWNTSQNTLVDSLGNTVLNQDGTPLEPALSGETVYKSLDGVNRVHVDGDTTIDLTGASSDSATDPNRGLVVSNLSGDGESTLSIEGNGDDLVTLSTQQGFTPEQTAKLSLSGLEAKLEGNLSLKELDMVMSSLDANGNTLTVENLSGDKDSTLSGTVIVTGSNSFLGTYEGNTTVELTEGSDQVLNASDGLTVSGSAGTAELVVKENSSITAIDTTGTNVTFTNEGVNTLVLTETSTMDGGTLALDVSLKKVSAHLLGGDAYTATTNSALKLSGVAIEVTMTDTDKVSELSISSTDSDIVLFRISDHADSTIDDCTLTIHDRALLDKYFSDIRLVQGSINVVGTRRTNYYGDKFTGLSANGAAGVGFAGLVLSYVDPQNTDKDGDLAKVLNALDSMAPGANPAADKLGAAFAGAGTAAMGAALAGDMDRQLRAVRNRTTTMGVSGNDGSGDMHTFNAWINAEGDYRTLDQDGTMAGYTLNSWGGTVGVDVDFSPHFTAGLAATAMYGDLEADSAETKAEGDMDAYYVSLFARYADKAWVHTFVASIGMADFTMDRTVTCGAEGSYATTGDTSGLSFGLMYEAGYAIALNEEGTACLQPVANITYKHTAVDGYNESGSDAALRVGNQTTDSVTFGVGARFQAAVGETTYNRSSLLELRALAKVEAGDRSSSADITLPDVPGASGTVESAEADAFGIELGAGVTVPVGVNSGALFLDVSAELRGSYSNVNGTFGYRINF